MADRDKEKQKGFNALGQLLVDLIKQQQIDRGLYSSGKTAASLRYVATPNGVDVYGDEAFIYQEKGRGPGKFPPPQTIRDWIQDKPIRAGITVESLAYLIGRSIAEKGTLIFQGKKQGLNFKEILSDGLRMSRNAIEDAIVKDVETIIKDAS